MSKEGEAAVKSYTVTDKEDWEGGTLNNLISSDKPGDLKLSSGGSVSYQAWQDPPNVVSGGAAGSDGTDIYLLRGLYDISFYKYSPAKNNWTTLADAPLQVGATTAMAYDGSGNFYVFFGKNTRQFYKYTIASNTWTALGDLPDTVSAGSNMVYSNGVLYVLRSSATIDFWSYTIATDSWGTLTSTPATFTNANAMATDGTYIYACRGTNLWYRYNIGSKIWEAMTTNLPITLAEQTDFVLKDGIVYFAAPNSAVYYKCELSGLSCTGNAWSTAATLPAAHRYGTAVYNPGDDYTYIFRGNSTYDFWKYKPGQSSVVGPSAFPQNFTTGGDMIWGSGDTVYGLKGAAAANGFYSYSLASNTWTLKTVTGLPTLSNDAKAVKAGDKIYISSAANTLFTAYDTTNDSAGWVAKTASPGAFGAGTSFTYLGGDLIYAMRGVSTLSFYAYSISNNNWTTFDPADLPAGLVPGIGARTVTNGTDIFASVGSSSNKFYKYTVSNDSWTEAASLPFGSYYGSDFTYYNGKIYAIDGNYRSGLYEYDITGDSWRKLADLQTETYAQNGFWSGSSIEYVGNNDLMISIGGSNAVFFYDVDNYSYSVSGNYESPSIDLANVSKWSSLSISKSTPTGTSVNVETKSCSDNSSWPESWTAVSGTTINSGANRYIKVKITLNANEARTLSPTVQSLTINYNPDDTDPSNPEQNSFTGLSAQGGESISQNADYHYAHPYFSWAAAADADSYVEGYYVYFGPNQSADPQVDGTYQSSTNYAVNDQISVGNNYLLIKTRDQAGNVTDHAVQGFVYKYVGASPAALTLTSNDDLGSDQNTNISVASDAFTLKNRDGFWQQQKLSVFPAISAAGASIIKKGNTLYATRGTTNAFYSYDIENDAWTTLSSTNLGTITTNGGLIDGPGNYIYAYRGLGSASFYRYDVTNDAAGWSDDTAEDVPAALGAGCNATYDGSRYIYLLKGASNVFYRFDPQGDENGTWETMEAANFGTNTVNNTVADGAQIVYDGNGTIYAIQGGLYAGGFTKYSTGSNSWTPLDFVPTGSSTGSAMVYDSIASKIYLIPGSSREYLYSFNPADATWTKLSDAPMVFAGGTAMVSSGDYLYVVRGGTTGFYRYRISKNSWETPTFNLFGTTFQGASTFLTNYGAAVLKGDNDNLYLTRGNYDTRFVRYDQKSGTLNQLPSLPSGSYQYSVFSYDEDRNDIYYISSSNGVFYRYDIDTEEWEALVSDPLPGAPAAGTSLSYDGSQYLYYVRTTTSWYRYDITADAGSRWSSALPVAGMSSVGYGSSSLVKDGYLYVNKGINANPNEFKKFELSQLPNGSWTALASVPFAVGYDSFLVDGENGKMYLAPAQNTNKFYEYTIETDTWTPAANFPGAIYQGGAASSSLANKIFTISGTGSGAYANGLYSYVIQSPTSSFEEEGSFISVAKELTNPYQFANLSLNYEERDNTTVSVYTQSSADGSVWSDWSLANGLKTYGTANHQYSVNSPVARYIKVKVALVSGDGVLSPLVNQIDINYYQDGAAPTNPVQLMQAKSAKANGLDVVSGIDKWSNATAPYFSWPIAESENGSSDGANGSGVAGYYLYLGTTENAVPSESRGIALESGKTGLHYQTDNDFEVSADSLSLDSGKTYYLNIQAADGAGNISSTVKNIFIFQFDNTAPLVPSSVNSAQNNDKTEFTFTWPASGESGGASDPDPDVNDSSVKYSNIKGYRYKINSGNWSDLTTELSVTSVNSDNPSGENTFYLRSVDNALNESTDKTLKFYIAPGSIAGLVSNPATSEASPASTNNFRFEWQPPENVFGSIKQYHYSFNQTPTAQNTLDKTTANTYLDFSSWATQQGKNTIYIVPEGDWGGSNIDYLHYLSLDFYVATPSPNPPESVQINDSSNRILNSYRLTVTWNAPSTGPQATSYIVKRSTDQQNYTEVGTTTSTGYLDSGLSGENTYYYRVLSKDSAGAMSAESNELTVSKKPTGKYTEPPAIHTTSIKAEPSASSSRIDWITSRSSDSFVEYGTSKDNLDATFGQRDEVTEHSVMLSGLKAGTKYYYRVQSLDAGDLRDYPQTTGYSEVFEFSTTPAPTLSDVSFSNVGVSSAILSFGTNKPSNAFIDYGTSTSYGSRIEDKSGGGVTQHLVMLSELQDNTTYQLKITIVDEENNIIESPGHSFTTLPKPKIESYTIEPVKDEATTTIKVSFVTNVEAYGAAQYSYDGKTLEKSSADFKKIHEFVISDLADQAEYSVLVIARDRLGNEVRSESKAFQTPLDTRPPQVSEIVVETSNVGAGREDQAQIAVSWKTDEPTTSMVEYGEGISGLEYASRTSEDKAYTTTHLVIIPNLKPGTPYHIRVVSLDRGANVANSEDHTVIPGDVPRSALQIIIKTLESLFGWMGKLIE